MMGQAFHHQNIFKMGAKSSHECAHYRQIDFGIIGKIQNNSAIIQH